MASAVVAASGAAAAAAGASDKQGECFVWGTGDAGQLGHGDDLQELGRGLHSSTSQLNLSRV